MRIAKNLKDQRFGRLVAIEYAGLVKSGKQRVSAWICRCDCGNKSIAMACNLQRNITRSCGCLQKENVSKAKTKNLLGKEFGKLKVVAKSDKISKNGTRYWWCKCKCGNLKEVITTTLNYNRISCGCQVKHGLARRGHKTKEYYDMLYKEKPEKKIRARISTTIHNSLKRRNGGKNGISTFDHLPYTIQDLKHHLEAQFQDWMTWENYGEWHIDHIIPQSHFQFTSMDNEEFRKCWALENLRPLERIQNLKKSNKLPNNSRMPQNLSKFH